MAVAKKLMLRSFAVLLRNHPWNIFIRNPTATQLDEAAMTAALDPLLAAVGSDFGPTPAMLQAMGCPARTRQPSKRGPDVLQPIGEKVIANFPDTFAPGSSEDGIASSSSSTGPRAAPRAYLNSGTTR